MKRVDHGSALLTASFVLALLGCGSSSNNGGSGGASGSGGKTGGSGGIASGSGGASDDAGDNGTITEAGTLPDAPTSSGVAPTTKLGDLAAGDKQKLCDYRAAKYGGYGKSVDCGNGTSIGADDDLNQCLGMNGLGGDCASATVSDFEKCNNDTTCDNPQPDSCQPLLDCQ